MTNDKQRLVELINEAEYESLNYEMANKFYPFDDYKSRSEFVADYLLANGVIVPPCKVGDAVFYVHEICDENGDEYIDISEGKCEGISMQKDGLWIYCRYDDGLTFWHKSDKTVFFSREEAEQALNNIQNGNSCEGGVQE